jgi:hypothetical protein
LAKDTSEQLENIENLVETFDMNQFYEKMTEYQVEKDVTDDLDYFMQSSLLELKAIVNYDLKIDEYESDTEFWKFVGNPLYRLIEKSIAGKCHQSVIYQKKFFERLDALTKAHSIIHKINSKKDV